MPVRAVAGLLGVSRQRVYQILAESCRPPRPSLPPPPPPPPPHDAEPLRAWPRPAPLSAEERARALAERFGEGAHAVRRRQAKAWPAGPANAA